MTPNEIKNQTAADRRITLTKVFADAYEDCIKLNVGKGGFDIEGTFHGTCATMTKDGLFPGTEPTFQSLKVHQRQNPNYKFTFDAPEINENDQTSSDESDDETGDVDNPDDHNDPEEVMEDEGEYNENDNANDSDDLNADFEIGLPFPEHLAEKWPVITDWEAAHQLLRQKPLPRIAHVFSTGWAIG